jgi:DNA repair exonuclease SbcCD ATPase subunit
MSTVEEMTSEMRRLVLRCRTLEARLADSIPKKNYNEGIAKLQGVVDSCQAELERTKQDLERTETLGGRMNAMSSKFSTLTDMVASQEAALKSLQESMSQATVPVEIYRQSETRIHDLEAQIQSMVKKDDYDSLVQKNSALEEQMTRLTPKQDYEKALARITELEGVVTNLMPKKDLDDLTETIMSITKSVPVTEEENSAPQVAPVDTGAIPLEVFQTPSAEPAENTPLNSE